MTRPIVLAVTLILALNADLRALAGDTMRPDELKRGMKGYGLTVFRGTKPERFDVEIVDILKNALPKQDMILIRTTGQNLENYKSVAGMSGSPIYINDKLIGAYAYGWGFQNEPIAGVTPIHNMMANLNVKPAPPQKPVGQGMVPLPWAPVAALTDLPFSNTSAFTPRRVLSPLALAGFSAPIIEQFRKEFEQIGFLPVAAAAGGAPTKLPRGKIEAGSALGVEIIRGDVSAVVTGTATYVDGDKVLAFGHPFFGGGRTSGPAVLSEVKHVMSSLIGSFKMARPVADAGSMVGDWESCVVVNSSATATTIPMTVNVNNHDTGQEEGFTMELINNPAFSSLAARMALAQTVSAATGSSDDTTVRVVTRVQVGNRELKFENLFFNPSGGILAQGMFWQVASAFQSPFGFPEVKKIDSQVEVWLTRRTAEIKRAYFTQPQLQRGEKAKLRVVLKPFNQPEEIREVEVEVPTEFTEPTLPVFVMAGGRVSAETASPESLSDYLDTLEKTPRTTDLVVIVPRPSPAVRYQGKILKDLPATTMNALAGQSMGMLSRDLRRTLISTDWVLSGSTGVVVPIKQE